MNIYVGNLSPEVTDEDLKALFGQHGQVTSAVVIKDKFTGRSRGFGFVEMPGKEQATAALAALNGVELKGQAIRVDEARPKTEGGGRGGGFRGGGGRPGGGRGGGWGGGRGDRY